MTRPTLAETDAALEGSIRKWEKIIDGTGEDKGVENCPLCELFYYQGKRCNGCPVMIATGHQYCGRSPYSDWLRHAGDLKVDCATTPRLVKLARAELAFLKSLRRKPGKAKA